MVDCHWSRPMLAISGPELWRYVTQPSACKRRMASRIRTWLMSRSRASASITRRWPGWYRPLSIRSRIKRYASSCLFDLTGASCRGRRGVRAAPLGMCVAAIILDRSCPVGQDVADGGVHDVQRFETGVAGTDHQTVHGPFARDTPGFAEQHRLAQCVFVAGEHVLTQHHVRMDRARS